MNDYEFYDDDCLASTAIIGIDADGHSICTYDDIVDWMRDDGCCGGESIDDWLMCHGLWAPGDQERGPVLAYPIY